VRDHESTLISIITLAEPTSRVVKSKHATLVTPSENAEARTASRLPS
jgi:hypothetical protein